MTNPTGSTEGGRRMTDYGDDPVMKLYEAEKHGTPKPDPHAVLLERIAAALELIAERMTLR